MIVHCPFDPLLCIYAVRRIMFSSVHQQQWRRPYPIQSDLPVSHPLTYSHWNIFIQHLITYLWAMRVTRFEWPTKSVSRHFNCDRLPYRYIITLSNIFAAVLTYVITNVSTSAANAMKSLGDEVHPFFWV